MNKEEKNREPSRRKSNEYSCKIRQAEKASVKVAGISDKLLRRQELMDCIAQQEAELAMIDGITKAYCQRGIYSPL